MVSLGLLSEAGRADLGKRMQRVGLELEENQTPPPHPTPKLQGLWLFMFFDNRAPEGQGKCATSIRILFYFFKDTTSEVFPLKTLIISKTKQIDTGIIQVSASKRQFFISPSLNIYCFPSKSMTEIHLFLSLFFPPFHFFPLPFTSPHTEFTLYLILDRHL